MYIDIWSLTGCNNTFLSGKSAVAVAGEFDLMFINTEVHKIVYISKTSQGNPNL